MRYLEDGRYEIDTNLVENAIRPRCVSKKNWLFIGHPDAGWRSLHTEVLGDCPGVTFYRVTVRRSRDAVYGGMCRMGG
jgi:hypothetical protein